MFKKLRNKIESKRNSDNLFWKSLVFGKDAVWSVFYYPLSKLRIIYEYSFKSLFFKSQSSRKDKKLVIIIPYRDREEHLEEFIRYMKFFLKNIDYEIVVIEQTQGKLFNRGKLFNSGFDLTKHEDNYFCFHDVDLLPENKQCDYGYPYCVVHLAAFCQQHDYKLVCLDSLGGVVLFNQQDFEKINGYSNKYWGWGKEDDDLFKRVKYFKLLYLHKKGRYRCLPHKSIKFKDVLEKEHYKKNLKKLGSNYDYRKDGLSTLKYKVLRKQKFEGYIKYVVEI